MVSFGDCGVLALRMKPIFEARALANMAARKGEQAGASSPKSDELTPDICASPLRGPGGDVPVYKFPRLKIIELIEYIEGYEAHQSPGKTRSGFLPTGASLAASACALGLVSGSRPDADLMLLTSSSASRLR